MRKLFTLKRLQTSRFLTSALAFSLVIWTSGNLGHGEESSSSEASSAEKPTVVAPEEAAKPQEIGLIVKNIEIRFAGPKTTNDSIILANLRTKVGEPFTQTQSDDDVRSLYATGLFSNVRIFQERLDDGGVKVVVLVQGKSKLKDVLFEGNKKFKGDKLRKEVKLKNGDTVSEKQIAEGAKAITEFYEKSGYQQVKVSYEANPDELTGETIVKYIVNEGDRIKIEKVNFEGNKAFTTKILRKKVETQKYNWWISWFTKKGFLKETDIEEDKKRLVEFYRSEGYIDADVKDVKYEYPTKDTMTVTFFVFEGNQYKVGKFDITGNKLFSTADIEKVLVMKSGDTFIPRGTDKDKPKGLDADVKAIQDLYGKKGYIDTVVKANRVPNISTGTMDLNLDIREGEQSYIELIQIRGNTKTKDKVIRRELAVAPGEIYDTVKVNASKQRLENLGYFTDPNGTNHVSIQPEDTDVPNRKNVVISVEEQRTGNFSFGAGFSSVESIFGFVEVSQQNFDIANPPYFTGAGQKARFRAQIGPERQDFIASFTEPWFLNKRLSAGFDVFYNDSSYLSDLYQQRNYGMDLRLGKSLGEFARADLMYKIENIELYDIATSAPSTIQEEKGTRSKSSVGLTLTRDTRDNLRLPGKGYKAELWSEVAGGPALGGDTDIYKFGFNGQQYFTMPWWEKNILSFNGSAGIVEQWSDGKRVPIFDRFFLGGPGSVRGFRYRDVGPKDTVSTEPVGGKSMAYIQTEYSIPVIEMVRFATWVDEGQVWEKSYFDGHTDPSLGAGLGLRLNLPIGGGMPINLDYGWPIVHDNQTGDSGRFSFSGGTKF